MQGLQKGISGGRNSIHIGLEAVKGLGMEVPGREGSKGQNMYG